MIVDGSIRYPTLDLAKIASEVSEVLNVHTPNTELMYPWSIIRDHLTACHLYLSPQDILIRPLIPPTWSHAPFASPGSVYICRRHLV